jgi:hypothetical protein
MLDITQPTLEINGRPGVRLWAFGASLIANANGRFVEGFKWINISNADVQRRGFEGRYRPL